MKMPPRMGAVRRLAAAQRAGSIGHDAIAGIPTGCDQIKATCDDIGQKNGTAGIGTGPFWSKMGFQPSE